MIPLDETDRRKSRVPPPPAVANDTALPVQPAFMPFGVPMDPVVMPQRRGTRTAQILLFSFAFSIVAMQCAQIAMFADPSLMASPRPFNFGFWVVLFGVAGFYGCGIGQFVFTLIWLFRVHRDLRYLTAGVHRPGPALAIGLMFIPMFNTFWLWRMLRGLSRRTTEPLCDCMGQQAARADRPRGRAWANVFAILFTMMLAVCAAGIVVAFTGLWRHLSFEATYVLFVATPWGLYALSCGALLIALDVVGRAIGDYTESHMAAARSMPLGVAAGAGKMPISVPLTAAAEHAGPAKECDA